ncbi:MAG: 2-amino-4-hydroxy-6-hydroxymethyldihydropteridine diphosphokinase, partial [Microbacterium sp.]
MSGNDAPHLGPGSGRIPPVSPGAVRSAPIPPIPPLPPALIAAPPGVDGTPLPPASAPAAPTRVRVHRPADGLGPAFVGAPAGP